jgi:hypothetical protein
VINEQGTPPETRIIAICNEHAPDKTLEDALRPDLYYRLGGAEDHAAAAAQRGEDILTLFTRLSEQFAEEYGCDAPQVTAQEAAQLLQAPWPGNVRQLVNMAERAVLQNRRGSGSIASLLMADNEAAGPAMTTEGKPLKDYVEAFERMLIDNTMRRHKGSDRRGDGGIVPAAPDAEREDGEIRPAAVGLSDLSPAGLGPRGRRPADLPLSPLSYARLLPLGSPNVVASCSADVFSIAPECIRVFAAAGQPDWLCPPARRPANCPRGRRPKAVTPQVADNRWRRKARMREPR